MITNWNLIGNFRLVVYIFIFSAYLFTTPTPVNAQSGCSGMSWDNCGPGDACSCNQTAFDNCRDLGTNCSAEEINCHCEKLPLNQVPCYHTICPVGYSCVGYGDSSYCEAAPTTNPNPGCWDGNVDCPPGWTISTGQPTNTFCSMNPTYGSNMCAYATGGGQLGSAQRETGCCNWRDDPDNPGEVFCPRNHQITTYTCCPPGATEVCTEVSETYTKQITYPSNPLNSCWQVDTYGNTRFDTYVSHVNTNCREVPVRDEDGNKTGETETICDAVVTCSKTTQSCSCGAQPTPTTTPVGSCLDVKGYTPTWTLHTSATLSNLRSGNSVYFCARGSTNMGTFTKAKFTINSGARPETATARPGTTNEFCDLYTIPANTYNFAISGQMYHSTLGWIQ